MRGERFVQIGLISNWLICTYFAKMRPDLKSYENRIKANNLSVLPLGAKPKGGRVPKCSLLASNSKLKDAASLKGLISRF